MVIIYKFYKDEIFIQPPGEHHLGDVRPKKFGLQKNFIKDKMTGRGAFLRKLQKSQQWSHRNGKTSFLVNLSENVKKFAFLGPVTTISTFLQFSQKCARQTISTLSVILYFI